MTQERINEILAIVDRAKEYDGINYALERAINELIREVQALTEKLNAEQKITDYLRSPAQRGGEGLDNSNTDSLLQLNRKLMELQLELKREKQDFEKRCDALNNEINQVRRNINLCKSSVDANKVNHAMTILDLQFPVQRNYHGGTNKVLPIYSDLVNAAKADLSTGVTKLRTEYIGQKRYGGFDQREDCRYGYGPRHGSIYQRIGLRNPKQELSDYDLECCLYLLENISAVAESKNI